MLVAVQVFGRVEMLQTDHVITFDRYAAEFGLVLVGALDDPERVRVAGVGEAGHGLLAGAGAVGNVMRVETVARGDVLKFDGGAVGDYVHFFVIFKVGRSKS